jgi:hypothetical protein
MTMSAPASAARSNARSKAPGSSGFGNATVGKSGSGSACAATDMGAGNPAACSTLRITSVPTPCIAVCTMLSSRGPSETSPATAAT